MEDIKCTLRWSLALLMLTLILAGGAALWIARSLLALWPVAAPVIHPSPAESAPPRPAQVVAASAPATPQEVDDKWHTWTASWYGEESGGVTASGERFDPQGLTAAHRTLPFGTQLEVCWRGCVRVRVNDRGPFVEGRDLDLSRGAAEALGMIEAGVVPVRVRIVREE